MWVSETLFLLQELKRQWRFKEAKTFWISLEYSIMMRQDLHASSINKKISSNIFHIFHFHSYECFSTWLTRSHDSLCHIAFRMRASLNYLAWGLPVFCFGFMHFLATSFYSYHHCLPLLSHSSIVCITADFFAFTYSRTTTLWVKRLL